MKLTPDDAQLVHVVRMELKNHRQHPDLMFLNVSEAHQKVSSVSYLVGFRHA